MKHSIQLNDPYKINGDFSDQLERRVRFLESGISAIEAIQAHRGWFHKASDFILGPDEPDLYLTQAKSYFHQSREFLKIGYFGESYRFLGKSAEALREYHQRLGTYLNQSILHESKIAFGIKCAFTAGALFLTAAVFSPFLPYLPFAIQLATTGGSIGAIQAGVGLIAGGAAVYSSASLIGRIFTPGEKAFDVSQLHKDMRVGAFIGFGSFIAPFAGAAGSGLAYGKEGITRFFLQNLPIAVTSGTLSMARVYSEEQDLKKTALVGGISVAASYALPAMILGANWVNSLGHPEILETDPLPFQTSLIPNKNILPANDNAYALGDPVTGRSLPMPVGREVAYFGAPYQGGAAAPQLQPAFYPTPLTHSSSVPQLSLLPYPVQPALETLIDLRARDLLIMPVLTQEWISLWDVQKNRVKTAADLQQEKWLQEFFEPQSPNPMNIRMSGEGIDSVSVDDLMRELDSKDFNRTIVAAEIILRKSREDPKQLTTELIGKLVEVSFETGIEEVQEKMFLTLQELLETVDGAQLIQEKILLRLLEYRFSYYPVIDPTSDSSAAFNIFGFPRLLDFFGKVLKSRKFESIKLYEILLNKVFSQPGWFLYGKVWYTVPAINLVLEISRTFPSLLKPSMFAELVSVVLWSCEKYERGIAKTILQETCPSFVDPQILQYLIEYEPDSEIGISRDVLKYLIQQDWFRAVLRLSFIEFSDGGGARSPILDFMKDYITTPKVVDNPIVVDDLTYSQHRAELADFLHLHHAQAEIFRQLGRSAVYQMEDGINLLILKYLRADQSPEDLVREVFFQRRINLDSALGIYLPIPILGSHQEPILWEFEGKKRAIAFTTRPEDQYYRYLDDLDLDFITFSAGLKRSIQGVFRLAQQGIYHTAPVPLFHNIAITDRPREDAGRFLVGVGLLKRGHQGLGMLDNYQQAFRFGNFGLSGPRDPEEWAGLDEIMQNMQKWMLGYEELLTRPNARGLIQAVLFGNYYFVATLYIGLRIKKDSQNYSVQNPLAYWRDDQWLQPYADLLLEIYSTGYSETKGISLEEAKKKLQPRADWLRLARQLSFFMTNAYVPYVAQVARVERFPPQIYPSNVLIPRFGPYRSGRFDSNLGFLGTDGAPSLGTVNGQFPIKEFETAWLATILDPDDS